MFCFAVVFCKEFEFSRLLMLEMLFCYLQNHSRSVFNDSLHFVSSHEENHLLATGISWLA